MKRILISLIVLSIAFLGGTAQAASDAASKPANKQELKRSDTRQEAHCPEEPPRRNELKKKSTTKKVEPTEPAKKPSP